MLIRLKQQKLMLCGMLSVLITYETVKLSAYPSLLLAHYLFLCLCLLSFFVMVCICLRRPRMSRFEGWVAVYYVLLLLITLINGTSVGNLIIYQSTEVLLLLMLFSYFRGSLALMIKVCAVLFSVMIYANFVSMVLFPDWMFTAKDVFNNYLLGGNYNQMGVRMLCGLVTNILCVRFNKKWLLNVAALSVVSLVTLLLVTSMTALTCVCLFLLFCLVPSLWLRKVGLACVFIVFLFLQITLVFGGEGLANNEYASYFIEQVLGKNMSFTHRTELWAAAGHLFAESPLWGYGCVDIDWYLSHLSTVGKGPHNFLYGILLNGGIMLFTVFVAICVAVMRKVYATRWDGYCLVLIMGVEMRLFMGLMEEYPMFFMIYLLVLLYYYPDLCAEEKRAAPSDCHAEIALKEAQCLSDTRKNP